ncbi:glycosyltransferase [Nonlabens spongiae]|nr:glycosyltransferase [Nonlabens spongiae]
MNKNILVAPLNWGLGHATRCVPIIRAIIDSANNPIIASDGNALLYLKKEFPNLTFVELPSYNISYPLNGNHFKLKLLKDSPKIWSALRSEHTRLKTIIQEYAIDLVISDNRLGLFSDIVPTVFITHQLNVLSGSTTWLSTQLHAHFIKKFNYCWIPDYEENTLAGRLSNSENLKIDKVYIGPLSRLSYTQSTKFKYDLLILLSGPEPQRTVLENKLRKQLVGYTGKVLFVSGKMQGKQKVKKVGKITYYNYLTASGIQKALDRSKIVLCRSGYSTIMDLHQLRKKAFFIPTPGQFEQEYLAEYLEDKKIAPYSSQDEFTIQLLSKVDDYNGFSISQSFSTSTSISSTLEEAFSRVNENSEPIPNSLST